MEYKRVNWKGVPDTSTPISADNLNIMDKGVEDAAKEINANRILDSNTEYITDIIYNEESEGLEIIEESTTEEKTYSIKEYLSNIASFFKTIGSVVNDIVTKMKTHTEEIEENKLAISELNSNLNGISFLTGRITTKPTITVPNGTYIMFFAKTEYTQSSIWVIDNNGIQALVNNCEETLTRTKNEDETITLTFAKSIYSRYLLVRLI